MLAAELGSANQASIAAEGHHEVCFSERVEWHRMNLKRRGSIRFGEDLNPFGLQQGRGSARRADRVWAVHMDKQVYPHRALDHSREPTGPRGTVGSLEMMRESLASWRRNGLQTIKISLHLSGVGVNLERALKHLNRFGSSVQLLQHDGEVVVGRNEVWIRPNGGPEARFCL